MKTTTVAQFVLLFAAIRSLHAADINGQVVDSSGAVVPEATVTAKSGSTTVATTVTRPDGTFTLTLTSNGLVRLEVALKGFEPAAQELDVAVPGDKRIVITLRPQSARQEITVRGELSEYEVHTATTATRTDTPLRDIPQSIEVVPKAVIDDQQAIRAGDAVRNVSGVTRSVGLGLGDGNDRYTIRGFLTAYSLKDGFKNNSLLTITDMANVDRVEVLKGPSAILYGRVEPGGIVNVVTDRPASDQHYSGQFLMGSDNEYRQTLDLVGPPLLHGLFYRLDGAYENSGSYRDGLHSETVFIAPALTWNLGRRTSIRVQGEHLKLQGRPDAGLPLDSRSFKLPISFNIGEPFDNLKEFNARCGYFLSHQLTEHWTLTNSFSALWIHADRRQVWNPLFSSDGTSITRGVNFEHDLGQARFLRFDTVGKEATWGIEHAVLIGVEGAKKTISAKQRPGG